MAWQDDPATKKQRDFLQSTGAEVPRGITKGEASQLIQDYIAEDRSRAGGCSCLGSIGKMAAAVAILGTGAAIYMSWKDEPPPIAAPVPPTQKTEKNTPANAPAQPAAKAAEAKPTAELAQARAIARFPQLGIGGSPLNRAFVERVKFLRAHHSPLLDDPEWPSRVAEEVFKTLPP